MWNQLNIPFQLFFLIWIGCIWSNCICTAPAPVQPSELPSAANFFLEQGPNQRVSWPTLELQLQDVTCTGNATMPEIQSFLSCGKSHFLLQLAGYCRHSTGSLFNIEHTPRPFWTNLLESKQFLCLQQCDGWTNVMYLESGEFTLKTTGNKKNTGFVVPKSPGSIGWTWGRFQRWRRRTHGTSLA